MNDSEQKYFSKPLLPIDCYTIYRYIWLAPALRRGPNTWKCRVGVRGAVYGLASILTFLLLYNTCPVSCYSKSSTKTPNPAIVILCLMLPRPFLILALSQHFCLIVYRHLLLHLLCLFIMPQRAGGIYLGIIVRTS